MYNLSQVQDIFIQRAGVSDFTEFRRLSRSHRAFYNKLCKLWNPEEISPDDYPDVDVATKVSDEKFKELEEEFNNLPK